MGATGTGWPQGSSSGSRRHLVDVARGRVPADSVIRGGQLVNVLTAELFDADIAIEGQRIAAVSDVAYTVGEQTRIVAASGRYVVPGVVEGHLNQCRERAELKITTIYAHKQGD